MAVSGSQAYTAEFYEHLDQTTRYAACLMLGHLENWVGPFGSVVDFGCGTGTWISVASQQGVQETLGIEGRWLDPKLAVVPEDQLLLTDLEDRVELPRRYDLAISLEVAEHLSAGRGASFVGDICAASDLVMFSAAVPGQGGTRHVNERPQSYWCSMFSAFSYTCFDVMRPVIWDDAQIPFWYRQNTLLFAKRQTDEEMRLRGMVCKLSTGWPLDIVHPELLLTVCQRRTGVRSAVAHLAKEALLKARSVLPARFRLS